VVRLRLARVEENGALSGEDIITAALLVIGDEILSGRTYDRNVNYVATHLTSIGIRLREVRVVADDEAAIVEGINALRARYTYLFTTGGIGPTHDDITADAVAKALGVSIDHDPRAVALLDAYFAGRGVEATPARMRMARIPSGADLITNALSVAPGFMIGNVIVLAGVPDVMQVMLDDVTPKLRTGAKMITATIQLFRPEGDVADIFAAHQKTFPDVAMGSYPSFASGRVSTQLVLRSTDSRLLQRAREELERLLAARGLL
jgi:molybdenum cofactor synthesis domain-containing protein